MGKNFFDRMKINNIKYCQPKGISWASSRVIVQTQVNTNKASAKFETDWWQADPMVLILGFLGWTIPSAIPVSGFGGSSLLFKFTDSIGNELAHFPIGPALDSEFWLYFLLYHYGLFLCLLLGQIGVQGRKQGYFN